MSITAPSFDNAPEWANFVAMDGDGNWYWYEKEPVYRCDGWRLLAREPGRVAYAGVSVPPASQTLTTRPSKESRQ